MEFHERNQPLLNALIGAALAKKAEGRNEYSLDQLVGDARWGDTETDRGDDPVKINGKWSPWYSRALQMVEPRLIGFFAVRSSVADSLVWIDHCSWQQVASEHEDEINWKDPFAELPDSRLFRGRKALDLAAVLKRKIQPAFEKLGITGVGWHTFRHTVGTLLAELGEHQLTIRDYLRHANLSVTNKYLQAASKTKRDAQARLVEAILPVHLLPGKTGEPVAP